MKRLSRDEKALIEATFEQYLNGIQDGLLERGLDEESANTLIFASADKLRDLGRLPPFPVNSGDHAGLGKWFVQAQDMQFENFVAKVLVKLDG